MHDYTGHFSKILAVIGCESYCTTYKHSSKYLYIVHYILTATCCFKRYLQAEFLPRAYIELRRHLEFEIIKAESVFRFVSRVHMPTRGKSRNREITAIYSTATVICQSSSACFRVFYRYVNIRYKSTTCNFLFLFLSLASTTNVRNTA